MKIFCFDKGFGVPVVLIHGYPLDHRIWKHQFHLSNSFHIIALDLPGFGQSEPQSITSIEDYADSVVQFLDEKKIERAVVCGHSMGGYIALSLAERYPERLLGMGLICTHAGADTEEARRNRLNTISRVEKEGTAVVVDLMSEKLLSPNHFRNNPALVGELKTIISQAPAKSIITAQRAMAERKNQETTLENFSRPCLIVSGKDDVLISPEKSERMASLLKNVKHEQMEGVGHLAMMERPEQFNKSLVNLLKEF